MTAPTATNPAPLTGVTVLDLTRVLAGPYATMLLADLGARVIKIEAPNGDDSRQFGPFINRKSAYFASLNRGKQSITLNLKTPADRAIFERLAAKAEVLVENYRAGVMDGWGYDWPALHALNPRLIVAAISGFGHTGPYRDLPAYDLVVQALGGLMSITGGGGDEAPARVGTSIGDIAAGLFGVSGILAALHRRGVSGEGSRVDVGMLDCQVAILENAISRHLSGGEVPAALGMRHPTITPFDGFRVGDDYLVIAAGNDALFLKLCIALGLPMLATQDDYQTNHRRTQNQAALRAELERALARKTAAEWLEILRAAGVPCAPVNDIRQVVNDPQVQARNMIISTTDSTGTQTQMAGNPIKINNTPDPKTRPAAPDLDADREEILRWLDG